MINLSDGMLINLTDEDFENALAFSHLMFKNGGLLYTSQASMSSDLLGYFSRWQNKYFEKIVLEDLFPNNIKIISDFFIYGNKVASKGIAPDLIGVEKDGSIYPFASLGEDGWEGISDTPQIEIKTTKDTSYLWTVTDSQVLDFLICIETHINQDYFTKKMMTNLNYDWSQFNLDNLIDDFDKDDTGYIKKFSDINTQIEDTGWGQVELTKIIKKSDISKFFKLMQPEQSPVYIKNSEEFLSHISIGSTTEKWKVYGTRFGDCNPAQIDKKNLIKIKKGKSLLDFINVENNAIIDHFTNEALFLPCLVEANEDLEIEILAASGSSIYLRTLGEIDILGKKLFPSDEQAYKLGLTKFERSASRSEWCGHKSIGELIDDSTDEFLEIIKNL